MKPGSGAHLDPPPYPPPYPPLPRPSNGCSWRRCCMKPGSGAHLDPSPYPPPYPPLPRPLNGWCCMKPGSSAHLDPPPTTLPTTLPTPTSAFERLLKETVLHEAWLRCPEWPLSSDASLARAAKAGGGGRGSWSAGVVESRARGYPLCGVIHHLDPSSSSSRARPGGGGQEEGVRLSATICERMALEWPLNGGG